VPIVAPPERIGTMRALTVSTEIGGGFLATYACVSGDVNFRKFSKGSFGIKIGPPDSIACAERPMVGARPDP